ncbi:MAG: PorV/PorQ family protein [Crocinitomicaceae bacterium]|jgi:hypothetical protein|nr:PorV/PorQ family protein [Crocinitomicaceae bacterium]
MLRLFSTYNFTTDNALIKQVFKSMQKTNISILFFSLFVVLTVTFGQGDLAPKYSNEFLNIGVGAEALGMGNAVVANTGSVNSSFWNPAGLTKVDTWLDASLMHSEYFAGIAKYDYLGLAHSIDEKSTVGFSAIRFAVDDIPNTTQLIDNNGNIDYDRISVFTAADYGFLFSYARKLNIPNLSVGGNFKLVHRKAGDFAKSWGFGLDAGAQYTLKDKWKFGAVLRDATSTFNAWIFTLDETTKEVFLQTGNEIPENGLELTLPRLLLGGFREFDLGEKGLTLGTELNMSITTDGKRNAIIKSDFASIDPSFGFSLNYKTYISVRGGVNNFQYVKNFDDSEKLNFQPTIGLGVNIKGFSLDYAFTDIGDASVALYSHVISLRLKLNKPDNAKPKDE